MPSHLGRYEILQPIASGGMATVYLARSLGAGGFERLVAVKSMHPHIAADPDFVAMFLDEARLAARLRHPNAVATIDVQEDPLFLVMEYVEGPSLHRVLREMRRLGGRLPLGIALRIFLDVVDGLHAAHELTGPDGRSLHLVHRDVSPHNMLIGVDGVSRITDFGVARAESRLSSTRGNQVKGKIGYMAPEQVRSEPVDRRADVHAAGAVLWELLVGRALVRGEHEGALLAQVLAGPSTSPHQLDPGIPPPIDAVCMRALRLDPGERFQTAAELADALEQAAAAAGIAIATPRAVAAFVKELAVHDTPAVPAPRVGADLPSVGGPESAPPSTPATTGGAVVQAPNAARATRPRPGLLAAVGALVGIAVGVAAFVVVRDDHDARPGSATPATTAPMATVPSRIDPPASGALTVEATQAQASAGGVAHPAASTAPSSSASAAPSTAPSASPSAGPSTAPSAAGRPAPARPTTPRGPGGAPASPTSFRPADL